MKTYRFEARQLLVRPLNEVFGFFSDAANLEAITPAFLHFRILSSLPIAMRVGTVIDYRLSLFGFPVRWRSRITAWEPGVSFTDEQERGPYASWRHAHTFRATPGGTEMEDRVEYALPLGPLGRIAHAAFVSRMLERIFAHRREVTERLLDRGADRPSPG